MKKIQDVHRSDIPIQWMRPEDFHITLIPPWDIDDIKPLIDKLSDLKAQDLNLDNRHFSVVVSKSKGKFSTIEALLQNEDGMHQLASKIAHLVNRKPNHFKPHITLAWLKHLSSDQLSKINFSSIEKETLEYQTTFTRLVVMTSTEKPHCYKILSELKI